MLKIGSAYRKSKDIHYFNTNAAHVQELLQDGLA